MFAFNHDANPELIWECFGFDAPWNGWASPIVDAETLLDVLADAGWWHQTDDTVFHLAAEPDTDEEEIVVLAADSAGHYHLRDMGWTFMEAKSFDTKVLKFRAKKQN